jgi:hypothetical protein
MKYLIKLDAWKIGEYNPSKYSLKLNISGNDKRKLFYNKNSFC